MNKLFGVFSVFFLLSCSHLGHKDDIQARQVANEAKERFQIWSQEYLEEEARNRRDSGVMKSSMDISTFSIVWNGGIIGRRAVTLSSPSSGDIFTVSNFGRFRKFILDIGEWASCDDAGLPSHFNTLHQWVADKHKYTEIPVQENHCYLVYSDSGDGDWKAYGIFHVEEHVEGRRVILDQVRRIAFWQD